MYNWIGYALWSLLALAVGLSFSRRLRPTAARLLVAGVALRIVGSLARYEVLMGFYDGIGDATGYYGRGWQIAKLIWTFDVPLTSPAFWIERGKWWGTAIMDKISGLVLTAVGPSMRGEFLAFSLLAFVGIYATVAAVRRVQPRQSLRYAALVWLWPSLWFWPSSVGKEAVIVLAMGLVALGFVGDGERIRWFVFALGLALAFMIRPHVAAALGMAALIAVWLGTWQRASPRRILEAVLAVVLAVGLLYGMRAQFGLMDADLEGMVEFVQSAQQQTLTGGSNIGAPPSGLTAIPMTFVNLWMRPFPWEAHNATSLVSALEVVALWVVIWFHRRHVFWALRSWWRNRLLRFAVPLFLGYTLMLGLTFGNLGIIARQRAPLFLFVFMIVVAAPQQLRAARPRPAAGRETDRTPSRRTGAAAHGRTALLRRVPERGAGASEDGA